MRSSFQIKPKALLSYFLMIIKTLDIDTFPFLHHGPGLREGKALHGLVALSAGSVLRQPVPVTVDRVDQHATVEGVALLSGCLSRPRAPVWT